MKKSFVFYSFIFYFLSLIVIEITNPADVLFNYAIFYGIIIILEAVSLGVSYITYKTVNYYDIQNKILSRNYTLFTIFKLIIISAIIFFFALYLSSSFISNMIISDNSLEYIFKISSILILILPFIGILRGFLYITKVKFLIKYYYLIASFFKFVIIFIISLVSYFSKMDVLTVNYCYIIAITTFYLLLLLLLFILLRRILKDNYNNSVKFEKYHEKKEEILKRIKVYSFPMIGIILLLMMSFDVLYSNFLIKMGTNISNIKNYSIITCYVGILFNAFFIFSIFLICDFRKNTKKEILNNLIKALSISLAFSVFASIVYNYYPIYKYFIYLCPLQLLNIIVLMYLYNQNRRKIILNTISLSFIIKQFFNFVIIHYFKYTELANYNALITSSLLAYLIMFVILITYIIITYKLDGEFFVKSLFDIFAQLIIVTVIILLLKHIIYFENVFCGFLYIILGMFLYLKIRNYKKRIR